MEVVITILGPGQYIHIKRNRVHAFRKENGFDLPKSDCHYDLQVKLKDDPMFIESASVNDFRCLSYTWDCMIGGDDG